MSAQNNLAKAFKRLHVPGWPVVLANIYDTLSAQAVAELPSCKALATASYGVARANGTEDDDMTMEIALEAVRKIVPVAKAHNKPLSVDAQDGYGDKLEETITGLVKMGVVGVNLEDCDKDSQKMHSIDEAAGRVKRALAAAAKSGVPDFVVNARTDTLIWRGKEKDAMSEAIERGKAYLAAGATTVFVWGGSQRGVSRDEVAQLTKAFDGRLNVSLKMTEGKGDLTVKELAEIGVARISVGPAIQFVAMEAFKTHAEKLLADS